MLCHSPTRSWPLNEVRKYSGEGKYLFPSIRARSMVISNAAPLAALRKLGYE
ncbi:hypothetical protein [Desulfovibrio sp.]|uniref:hypothetical protein n=1 Tax=Desulfovibrio sp. TaxID=885 RepID=UPI002588CA20|nr:hypothetical protein [Desulfovibrio sp.]